MEEQTFKFLNKVFILGAVFVLGVLVYFVGQIIYQFTSLDRQNVNQITVSGEGKVYAKPDVVLVSLGVITEASNVADVTKKNTDKMNAVIEAIKKLGIEDKDIQTINYNLTPIYDSYYVPTSVPTAIPIMDYSTSYAVMGTKTALTGYELDQNIQVKVRDFTKISDVLAQSTASGANLVGDLQFTIDNPEQFKQEARAKAIEQAKANAQNLAKESGIKIGKLINVYENYIYPMSYSGKEMGIGGGSATDSVLTPIIQPGQQEINITINLTYQVR